MLRRLRGEKQPGEQRSGRETNSGSCQYHGKSEIANEKSIDRREAG